MSKGMLLSQGIFLILTGCTCLFFSARQYLRKGPVISSAYFASEKEEREKMKTPKAYRYAGNVLLYPGLICLLFGLSFVFDIGMFAYVATVMAVSGVLSAMVFIISKS